MTQLVPQGTAVTMLTHEGLHCLVGPRLGQGGQGEVLLAYLRGPQGAQQPFALKWYRSGWDTKDQWERLAEAVRKGPPHPGFLWPIDLVTGPVPGFGYLMRLKPHGFRSFSEVERRRIEPSLQVLVRVAANLADGFAALHAKGFCYRDVSANNFFFHPDTGETLICDTDNVAIDGQAPATIRGTAEFIAPEVLTRDAPPSTRTDLHSLAVLLFTILVQHHPLVGRRENEEEYRWDEDRLYGKDALFIFDPGDASNAPDPAYHENALVFWPLYPQFVRDLFTRAFTEGLRESARRVRETEWRRALVRLHDLVMFCRCGQQNFLDETASGRRTCWNCHVELPVPARIVLRRGSERSTVLLYSATKLCSAQLGLDPFDLQRGLASVVEHPTQPGVWGVRNDSGRSWVVRATTGETVRVDPGAVASIVHGNEIDFGRVTGRFELGPLVPRSSRR